MDAKIKHLEFIQLTITRMAANSFVLKGWSVTLVTALAVLAQKDSNVRFWVVSLIPVLVFWGLDAYFLRQERLFRKLYDAVRVKKDNEIDFSLDTQPFQGDVESWGKTVVSTTLGPFWWTIFFSIVLVGKLIFASK